MDIVGVLERATGHKAKLCDDLVHNVLPPTRDCILGDKFNTECYKNCTRIANNEFVAPTGYELLDSTSSISLEEYYKADGEFSRPNKLSTDRLRTFLFQ